MEYRKLNNTGTAVSHIAFGTMYFGVQTPEDEAFALLDAFVDAGGNLVDTSNVYGGGSSEEIVGRWFASRPTDVTEPVDVDPAVVQAAVHRPVPTTMLGQQRQVHRGLHSTVRTQHRVCQLEQLVAPGGQALVELSPET